LQPDFDRKLLLMFDKQSQGSLTSVSTAAGDDFSVAIDAQSALAPQGTLTTPFGFVDFVSGNDDVRVARPIAVAETVDALDDQQAIIRMRQTSTDKLTVKFYRVDDFAGTIDGLAPGDTGYAAAANTRLYATTSGGTSIKGPGYGKYGEASLVGVDAGDLIAMQLTQGKKTFWAFADANETVDGSPVSHLWNYGLNTWGWEDKYGGGDRDFNDLVVQLDFTSAYGDIFGTDDKLRGGKGDDDLSGLGGADIIHGNKGNDILDGGRGSDALIGAGGIDTFVFADGYDSDRVQDYQAGVDVFDFTGVAGVHAFSNLVLTPLNSKTVLIDFDGVDGGDTLTVQKTTIAALTANQGDFLFS
jgi:Ca2+-binding RTX toxin-like protein